VLLCSAFVSAPNPVQRENALPGTTAWQMRASGSAELYATPISAAPGDAVSVHVSTPDRYRLTVYRLGWYGGAGARLVTCLPTCDGNEQGIAQSQRSGLSGGAAGWAVTDVIQTGADWTSGYYLVEATLAHGGVATAFFVLHEQADAPASPIVVQVPVNTWQAYNTWGGASLYSFLGPRSIAVSLERPLGFMAQSPMWWEIQTVRFLEREGYDVSYQTDVDTDVDPASLLRHRLVIVAGHDEYWSSTMRDGFDTALAAGTNLAFMGSNDAYWNVGYGDGHTTVVSAKSLYDPNPILREKTAMFREIGRPECELMGVMHQFIVSVPTALDYAVTDAGAADPWLAGTGFHAGDTIAGVVGREHDVINPYPESCFHPGLTVLSTTRDATATRTATQSASPRRAAPVSSRPARSSSPGRSTTGGATARSSLRPRSSPGARWPSTPGCSNSCGTRSTTSRGRRRPSDSLPSSAGAGCGSRCPPRLTRACSGSSPPYGSETGGDGSVTAPRAAPPSSRRLTA
jgi:hypothetical protein